MSSDESLDEAMEPRAVVAALMAAQVVAGEAPGTGILLTRVCVAAAQHLAVLGVAVGLMSDTASVGVVASADQRSADLDELQYTVGEGPSRDAFRMQRPVLVADLGSPEGRAWPVYSDTAVEAGVAGVFAFPLHVGAATFGTFTIYADAGGGLGYQQLRIALAFAELATEILLDADPAPADGSLHAGVERVLSHRAEVYQAQGVVMVELGISLAEALARIRAHAFLNSQTLAEVSALIISGDLVLQAGDS